ncbi:MAG: biopolymer transporter ExbD [Bacteroidetes bacterium]|nr:biopolymer transporter ExbD [Bacteroidota bacterium]
MNLRKNNRYTAEVYTGSLNDIMFFLLLFFLIVSTLANPSVIKLMLPNAKSPSAVATKQVTLSVTADKKYFLNDSEVLLENLKPELEKAVKTMAEPTVVLRVDNALTVQDLVDVLQVGNEMKVKMVLATKAPKI